MVYVQVYADKNDFSVVQCHFQYYCITVRELFYEQNVDLIVSSYNCCPWSACPVGEYFVF